MTIATEIGFVYKSKKSKEMCFQFRLIVYSYIATVIDVAIKETVASGFDCLIYS